jgi:type II secretory pathway pseudopilin PulG
MKTYAHQQDGRGTAAFTLTELALCIAVIGLALTAILGVLPSGLNVQKANREDTLVAQDAQFLAEAIRGGALGIPDLTNQVEFIVWRRTGAVTGEEHYRGPNYTDPLPGTVIPLTDSWQVLALLSLPRYERTPRGVVENFVQAQFRSFGGPFTEKAYRGAGGLPDPARLATALRYVVTVENLSNLTTNLALYTMGVPAAPTRPPIVFARQTNLVQSNLFARTQYQLERSLNELSLTFQWPVFRVGNDVRVGNSRKTFRTQVMGERQVLTTNFMGTLRPAYRYDIGRTNQPSILF